MNSNQNNKTHLRFFDRKTTFKTQTIAHEKLTPFEENTSFVNVSAINNDVTIEEDGEDGYVLIERPNIIKNQSGSSTPPPEKKSSTNAPVKMQIVEKKQKLIGYYKQLSNVILIKIETLAALLMALYGSPEYVPQTFTVEQDSKPVGIFSTLLVNCEALSDVLERLKTRNIAIDYASYTAMLFLSFFLADDDPHKYNIYVEIRNNTAYFRRIDFDMAFYSVNFVVQAKKSQSTLSTFTARAAIPKLTAAQCSAFPVVRSGKGPHYFPTKRSSTVSSFLDKAYTEQDAQFFLTKCQHNDFNSALIKQMLKVVIIDELAIEQAIIACNFEQSQAYALRRVLTNNTNAVKVSLLRDKAKQVRAFLVKDPSVFLTIKEEYLQFNNTYDNKLVRGKTVQKNYLNFWFAIFNAETVQQISNLKALSHCSKHTTKAAMHHDKKQNSIVSALTTLAEKLLRILKITINNGMSLSSLTTLINHLSQFHEKVLMLEQQYATNNIYLESRATIIYLQNAIGTQLPPSDLFMPTNTESKAVSNHKKRYDYFREKLTTCQVRAESAALPLSRSMVITASPMTTTKNPQPTVEVIAEEELTTGEVFVF